MALPPVNHQQWWPWCCRTSSAGLVSDAHRAGERVKGALPALIRFDLPLPHACDSNSIETSRGAAWYSATGRSEFPDGEQIVPRSKADSSMHHRPTSHAKPGKPCAASVTKTSQSTAQNCYYLSVQSDYSRHCMTDFLFRQR